MLAKLRLPFFLLAIVVIGAVVLIEHGAVPATEVASRLPAWITGSDSTGLDQALALFPPEQRAKLNELRKNRSNELAGLNPDLKGFGVRSMQFVDSMLLFTMLLMALSLVIPMSWHGRIQGCLTAIFSIVVIIFALLFVLVALAKLLLMVGMLLAFPFGTISYMIIYGSFPRGAATAVLSLIFLLKAIFTILILLAHQGFVKNLGFLLYILGGFVANIVVSLLYSLVPLLLVSITDALAAIIVGIIGIILAIILLIGAIISIIAALNPG